jgi:uncharacterized protein YeaO (DUF488 family)
MKQELKKLARLSRKRTITLVYSAVDEEHNQAVVLMESLRELLSKGKLRREDGT